MTKPPAKTSAPNKPSHPVFAANRVFPLEVADGAAHAKIAQSVARQISAPETAAWRVITAAEGKAGFGDLVDAGGMLSELRQAATAVKAGDLTHAEAMLINQAMALQTLSASLIERGMRQQGLAQFEAYLRLGLRAQAQSRQSIETLALIKQGPAIFAKQANVAHGPQQVNNGVTTQTTRAGAASEIVPNQLSNSHELHSDADPSTRTTKADPAMAPVGKEHGAENT